MGMRTNSNTHSHPHAHASSPRRACHNQEECCASLREARLQNKHIDLESWLAGPQREGEAVCIDYHLGFYELPRLFPIPLKDWSSTEFSRFYLDNREFDTYRPALQPSIVLRQQVRTPASQQPVGRLPLVHCATELMNRGHARLWTLP